MPKLGILRLKIGSDMQSCIFRLSLILCFKEAAEGYKTPWSGGGSLDHGERLSQSSACDADGLRSKLDPKSTKNNQCQPKSSWSNSGISVLPKISDVTAKRSSGYVTQLGTVLARTCDHACSSSALSHASRRRRRARSSRPLQAVSGCPKGPVSVPMIPEPSPESSAP